MDNRIVIDIELNDGTIVRGLARAEQAAEATGRRIGDDLEDGIRRGTGRAFNGLRAGIIAAGAALATAFAGRAVIEAASRQQDAVNGLNQSLKNAGEFSQQASRDFQDFASGLQGRSIIGDEQLLEVAALARNFTQTNEQAMLLTEAALELSSATGKDLTSSLEQLGKTFGGSLGRLGDLVPDLRNLTAEQLKAGEATQFILDRFRGSAESETRTFSGAITQLSNTFGDLVERVGQYITQSPVLISLINRTTQFFQDLTESLPDGSFGNAIAQGIIVAATAVQTVIGSFQFLANLIRNVINAVLLLGSGFATVATGIRLAIVRSLTIPFQKFIDVLAAGVSFINSDLGNSIRNSLSGLRETVDQGATAAFNNSINGVKASYDLLVEDLGNTFQAGGSKAIDNFTTELLDGIQQAQSAASTLGTSSLGSTNGGGTTGGAGTTVTAPVAPAAQEALTIAQRQTAALRSFVIANQDLARSNSELFSEIGGDLIDSNAIITEALSSDDAALSTFQEKLNSIKEQSMSVAETLQSSLAGAGRRALQQFAAAGGQAFGKFAADIATGEARLQDFGKVIFGLIGDVLFQLGTQLIAAGIGNLIAQNYALGGAQIAGGTLIAAAGGALKARAGEGGGSVPSPSTSAGGGVTASPPSVVGGTTNNVANLGDTAGVGRQANITVNIEGNVLDRRETALEFIEVLEEARFAGIEVA